MELKMKYQYTNFIYPYIVEEKKYSKYLLKLLKNKSCQIKFFDMDKDIDLYKYFLPNIRKIMFCNFSYNKSRIEKFRKMDLEIQSTILGKYPSVSFEYKIEESIQGKVGQEDGIFFKIDAIQIICFNTGICFLVLKTHIENSQLFEDVLNFNCKFRDINSRYKGIKEFEKIKIQTDYFGNMNDIQKIIDSIIPKNSLTEKLDIDTERFLTYAYTCIEQEDWNENRKFEEIKNEFDKYTNVLPSNYNVRINNVKAHEISRLKFAKIGLTKISTALLTSGTDTFNYTKLPCIYENQYFYTYILQLYKKIYLRKISLEYKKNNVQETRRKFVEFTQNIWTQEITNEQEGIELIKEWEKVLELNNHYKKVKGKYDLIYKESKIEKTEKVNKTILVILVISLILNIINFWILLK